MNDESLDRLARPRFYRRNGRPYTGKKEEQLLAWAKDYELLSMRVVREQETIYGERLSTVWLGLDQNFLGNRPLIFETMLFDRAGTSLGEERYSTEEEALTGHERLWFWTLIPPPLRRFFARSPFSRT